LQDWDLSFAGKGRALLNLDYWKLESTVFAQFRFTRLTHLRPLS
jgi:hypothetical protein